MVVNYKIIQLLSSFGLSNYETRTYAGLMRTQSATAYEVARSAGIPISKIYETVNRLAGQEFSAVRIGEERSWTQYMALSAEYFIYLKQEETARNTERLADKLGSASHA